MYPESPECGRILFTETNERENTGKTGLAFDGFYHPWITKTGCHCTPLFERDNRAGDMTYCYIKLSHTEVTSVTVVICDTLR